MNSCLTFTSSFRPPSLLFHRLFNGSVISSRTSCCLSRLRSSSRSRSIISFQHVEMASSASQPSKSVATGDAIGASDVFQMIQSYQACYQEYNFKLRIPFPRRAHIRKDVKTNIMEMLQAAKATF